MPRCVYVMTADLVGSRGVERTIAVRSDQTLVDVHHALQGAFDWDDDHLYSFWMNGKFWAREGPEYTAPPHAAQPGPLAAFGARRPPRSAAVRLDRLKLDVGQRIAYIFDFGDEWRVMLTLRRIVGEDGAAYPRVIDAKGEAPPQYPGYDEEEEVA